ncbi:MAG: prevent-host-death protein [Nitrospiria bacterium]
MVVTRGGKPVAAIVDIPLFNKMRLLEEAFDRAQRELQDAFQGEGAEVVEETLRSAKRASRKRRSQ